MSPAAERAKAEAVLRAAAAHYRVSTHDILAHRREGERARQVAMALTQRLTALDSRAIAALFDRCESCGQKAAAAVARRAAADHHFAADFAALERQLREAFAADAVGRAA